jgi:hypothetical protein
LRKVQGSGMTKTILRIATAVYQVIKEFLTYLSIIVWSEKKEVIWNILKQTCRIGRSGDPEYHWQYQFVAVSKYHH